MVALSRLRKGACVVLPSGVTFTYTGGGCFRLACPTHTTGTYVWRRVRDVPYSERPNGAPKTRTHYTIYNRDGGQVDFRRLKEAIAHAEMRLRAHDAAARLAGGGRGKFWPGGTRRWGMPYGDIDRIITAAKTLGLFGARAVGVYGVCVQFRPDDISDTPIYAQVTEGTHSLFPEYVVVWVGRATRTAFEEVRYATLYDALAAIQKRYTVMDAARRLGA